MAEVVLSSLGMESCVSLEVGGLIFVGMVGDSSWAVKAAVDCSP